MSGKISRRMFLKGSGGFALAIPFLPSLLPQSAWGQTPSVVRRYFNFVGGYDYGHHQNWFPTLGELPLVHNPGNGDYSFRYQTLRSFAPNPDSDLSLILGRGLNPYLDKMNLFRGLNLHTRIAHGQGHMLGNIRATDGHDNQVVTLKGLPTIDHVLAANRNFNPHARDPLHVGDGYSFRRDASGNVTQAGQRWPKPHQLFDSLFNVNGSPLPENGGQTSAAHPRRDVLSRVFADYQRVRNGRNISAVDRQVLDNALDRISDVQSRLNGTTSAQGCRYTNVDVARSRTDGVANGYYYNPETHRYAFEMYARIYAAAASCDIHRVFNMHLNIPDHFDRHPSESFHHGHSHEPFQVVSANGGRINHRWMGEIWRTYVDSFLVPLVQSLDASLDTNGRTLLDNSLVHMTMESSTVHCDYNKPCLFIGSAGGNLTTGHYIDYSRRELGPHPRQGDHMNATPSSAQFGHVYYGQHYNRSLTTILRAMGLSPADYEDPSINTFFQNRSDGLLGAHNNGVTRVGGYGHVGSQNVGAEYSNNQELYSLQYSRYNYHFYKDSLPMPPRSSV